MHTVTPGGKVTNRLSTTDELAAMRARVDEATDGPWSASGEYAGSWEVTYTWRPGTELEECSRVLDVSDRFDACGNQGDAEFVAHARTDVPRLLDAVEAVLAMHEPVSRHLVNGGTFDECSYCVDPQDNTWRLDYPCPTVQAITSALGVTQ